MFSVAFVSPTHSVKMMRTQTHRWTTTGVGRRNRCALSCLRRMVERGCACKRCIVNSLHYWTSAAGEKAQCGGFHYNSRACVEHDVAQVLDSLTADGVHLAGKGKAGGHSSLPAAKLPWAASRPCTDNDNIKGKRIWNVDRAEQGEAASHSALQTGVCLPSSWN